MNFEKYRELDTIKLHGIFADVYTPNEKGELIDPVCGKDVLWLTGKSISAKSENFDFEKFVLDGINKEFIYDLEPTDIFICGGYLYFWKREDDDGIEDQNGDYYVSYAVAVTINGKYIDEEDLHDIFSNFEY